ncbi:MAG: effector-binding domain-containing protein [Flavobacterium sp.]|jgi:effector-binding domain-containing protein
MRILKYFFLLFLLLILGFTVYVATQKPNYEVVRSKYIAIPKASLFEFVQDYQNWEGFNEGVESANQNLEFSPKAEGKNAFVKWDYPSPGSYQTEYLKVGDSIAIQEDSNGQIAKQIWNFKDTIGGTLLKVSTKGTLNFKEKVLSFFKGGPNYVVGNQLEKNLENLKNNIVTELTTFQTKVTGVVTRPKQYYLMQSIVCREKNVEKNIKIMVPKMVSFFTKNEIESAGNPFLLFSKYDKINDIVAFSVCISIKDSVYTSKVSDIQFGVLESYSAVRTLLRGDHRHQQKAWKKATEYILKNQYNAAIEIPVIEVLSKYKNVKASQKTTEIFFPVYPKINLPVVSQPSILLKKAKDSVEVGIEKPKTPTINNPRVENLPATNRKLNTPKPSISTTIKTTVKPKAKQPVKPEVTSPAKKEITPNSETDEFEF